MVHFGVYSDTISQLTMGL